MTSAGEIVSSRFSKELSANSVSLAKLARTCVAISHNAWNWLTRHGQGVLRRDVTRRLKVAETVSLGEKRFVSILRVDGQQFLVGGSTTNIVLLAKLEAKPGAVGSFENVLAGVEVGVEASATDDENPTRVTR